MKARGRIMCLVVLATLAGLCARMPMAAQRVTQLPYVCDFEEEGGLQEWAYYRSGRPSDQWYEGTAVAHSGEYSLYVSADRGTTAGYTDRVAGGYAVVAYCRFDLPVGNYELEYAYMAGGGGDSLVVLWVPESQVNFVSTYGTPLLTQFHSIEAASQVVGRHSGVNSWATRKATLHTGSARYYYLMFFWKTNGDSLTVLPGGCIDDVVVYPDTTCYATPHDLSFVRQGDNLHFSWSANPALYEVEMLHVGSNSVIHSLTTTDTRFTADCSTLAEGTYQMRVRATCGGGQSPWVWSEGMLIYHPEQHCIDYADLRGSHVTCYYGNVAGSGPRTPYYGQNVSPYDHIGVVDQGYNSIRSRHTVHYMSTETDPRTGDTLLTVPPGYPASVRIGNWNSHNEAEAVDYTIHVDSMMGIVLVKYAVVLQEPGHDYQDQPRFTLEILDQQGNLIDADCGLADFRAYADMDNWHTIQGSDKVVWKDWTDLGLDVRAYAGQDVHIRFTTRDCGIGSHYGYAYVALDCSSGTIANYGCDLKPDSVTVDAGFNYRWYSRSNPSMVLGTEHTFRFPNLADTTVYCVDMISTYNPNCYFTLQATSLTRRPKAVMAVEYEPEQCQNRVRLINRSHQNGYYPTPDGTAAQVELTERCDRVEWDCGKYGTFLMDDSTLVLPRAGDTLHIRLVATMNGLPCADTAYSTLVVPPIGPTRDTVVLYVVNDEPASFLGKTYSEPGNYEDTIANHVGCDSLITLHIRPYLTDTIYLQDTVCQGQTYTFHNQQLTQSGLYTHHEPSLMVRADSLVSLLRLLVAEPVMAVVDGQAEYCPGEPAALRCQVTQGTPTAYSLLFDAEIRNQGVDDIIQRPLEADGSILLPQANLLSPGHYAATLVLHDWHCQDLETGVQFTVLYPADSLITQRWDDLLALRQQAVSRYGSFSHYQWIKNGQPLEGAANPIYYTPAEPLDTATTYRLCLTRTTDGQQLCSCDFHPQSQPHNTPLQALSLQANRLNLHLQAHDEGTVNIYTATGLLIRTLHLSTHQSLTIPLPCPGVYIITHTGPSGLQAYKVVSH